MSLWFHSVAQQNIREDILLNNDWTYSTGINNLQSFPPNTNNYYFTKVNLPHNADAYDGYRRLLHGNKHGDIWYRKVLKIVQQNKSRRNFLYFEGVGSYAKIYLNGDFIGEHAGGRTTFTIDVTGKLKTNGYPNEILVFASHPANIKDLPWVCGGCSDERGFSEGSQPMGIFRPVHLIVTNDVRIEPFGIHAWAEIKNDEALLSVNTTFKNYSLQNKIVTIVNQLVDVTGKIVKEVTLQQSLKAKDSITVLQNKIVIDNPNLWSVENPYLYKIISLIKENNLVIDKTETDFGFRTINFKTASHQFILNGKPVFINGIAEYEHLLGGSHAFSNEEIIARMKWVQSAGFNAFRDAHQPHNLLYGKLCDEKGILWWTQFSAHTWYDTKEFRENFKTLLREWVIERRNDPAVILWGLQNESKLPKDFAAECTALIRSLDPTASTQRLVTTCNGGEGTDWDVPQNWTGTYGGNPATYGNDLKKQILVGEYGAWRTLDLHSEGGFMQNGILSEDRMTQLMEQKIRLAESVKDSVAGHFFWLLTSHDNPGRVQGGEGLRELDRIGPVNYKGLLTPWEEPTDAYYMFRSNYVPKEKEPMVYIVSHTWPNRWMKPGIKDSIIVYSNCDEVELFNDIDNVSLGKQKRKGIGTHFQWDKVNIKYNVLYAVGYVDGKTVARDTIVLNHLPASLNYNKLLANTKNITKPKTGYQYVERVNCGGGIVKDENGNTWWPDRNNFSSWTTDFESMPKDFASQRRTFAPIKNSKDWKLFQSFRYGKDKLKFDFDVENGEYLVELYFIEPWLGIGGMNAKGMRVFDVSINNRVVIDDFDIWAAVGENTVIKKTFTVRTVNEKILISFPESKVGQALISAIAIAKKGENVNRRTATKRSGAYRMQSWLDVGDKQFENASIQFNSLPSNLFGADWIQLRSKEAEWVFQHHFYSSTDLFLSIKEGEKATGLLTGFENTNTQIITDEDNGTKYNVYRKRFAKDDTMIININSNIILCMQPVTNMQPAYDLKPTISYRPATAKLIGDSLIRSMINEKETISFNKNKTAIEWNINIGAADIYSLNLRYTNPADKNLSGTLQIIMADGTVMKNEKITFTPAKPGKWNYISTTTGSMVNAGNYIIRITADDAVGVGISGLDVQ
ncbi:malectin domain-containing carbohydrate-binding protein [Ferruginibacter sp. SUN106]|uniref:malectin domain-containing carbohydrate-binding protein n=1 Tax=Ferruginibacter sp. SUN106 TaxID=2978348 RepID=UPI003D365EDB